MQGLKTLISGLTAGNVGLLEIKFSHQEELDKIRLRDKYHMSNRGGPVTVRNGSGIKRIE